MADNIRRKCLKCGRSPKENPDIKLYRFPNPGPTNILRCETWAKFCFPSDEWHSKDFQKKIYAEHRMLCNKHFRDSAFIDYDKKKLNRNAIPEVEISKQTLPTVTTPQAMSLPPQYSSSDTLMDDPNTNKKEFERVPEPIPGPSKCNVIEVQPGPSHVLMDITNVKPAAKRVPEPIPGPSKCDVIEVQPGPSHILMDITNVKPAAKSLLSPRCSQVISQREKALYNKCRLYVKRIWKLKKTFTNKNKLDNLNSLHETSSYQKLIKKLTPSFAILLQSQLKNVRRKTKGRRWTLEEKIIALRLYKRSPMCYRLLRSMWCLPAPATLKSLLGKFNLNIGINEKILNSLEEYVKCLQSSDNEFVLMFDEMSLKKHLEYNSKLDIIEGYQDHGSQHGRSEQEATHALVFMVAGIRKKVKQPIAFYLSSSYVTADRLAVLIKEVLQACFNIGLCISATVCDMDGVNRRALSVLGATKENPYFSILNNEVVTLFDPPHLLKCFRNLFMKYDIKCSTDIKSNNQTGQGLAKWSHIKDFFDIDNENVNFVFAPTLRKQHLNPNMKEKMRVKLAAQVLSHSVAAGMFAKISEGHLPSDASVTADLIANMDKLFDCLNSESPDLRRGKPYATNLSEKSPHLNFFFTMRKLFANLEYVGCPRAPPSQQGWIWSLNAIERLWRNLTLKHSVIKSLATRRLQQDPLENLFGCIRGNCGANSNPTVGQFIAALKTAIMSNLAHLVHGNCEQDKNVLILDNFKKLLVYTQYPAEDATSEFQRETYCTPLVTDENISLVDSAELQACAYVCGFLLKRKRGECKNCELFMLNSDKDYGEIIYNFMEFKEYSDLKKSLIYTSKELIKCVECCATMINNFLRARGHIINIKKSILEYCYENINFSFITCHRNENVDFILNNVFHICVKRYCNLKNREFHDAYSSTLLNKKMNIIKHK